MANFVQVDEYNIVRDVIVISNEDCAGGIFPESEPVGQAFINGPHPDCLALDGNWLQTSYSGSFRGCFAGLGFSYDPVVDVFVPPSGPGVAP
jgi:hypothetical protein